MKTPFESYDAASSEFDELNSGGTATLDPCDSPEVSENSDWTGPLCEKCEAPLKSDVVTVCRHCGWYASLGTYLEVDQDYEVYGDHAEADATPQPQPSHLQVWLTLLPRWAWIMIGTAAAVVVESVAVRLVAPSDSSIRTVWALTQLAGGQLIFFGCHLLNLLIVAGDDPDVGVLDMFLKPMKLWGKAFRALPKRLWITNAAANGLLAADLAVLVIGGIPYERLWDWGFKEPPKQNLMGAVMAQAAKVQDNGNKDLAGAIGDFAGKANVDGAGKKSKPEPKPAAKPRQKTDCVILGYHADKDGNVLSLVLGTALGGKLVYACSVTPKLEGKELTAFTKALVAARSDRPFLDVQSDAVWVRPAFSCRVSYVEQDESGRLGSAEWVQLLGLTGL
ncbi:MAG TPA: hypothetical protein VGM76_02110 [Lacipirellulaceae bacterium]